ncbi:MAG: hypothetical protein COC15_03935 [Legionellales bacterium]|nr:MAG: hypothetical protein COC15_03935 [Legionellales bacterium]
MRKIIVVLIVFFSSVVLADTTIEAAKMQQLDLMLQEAARDVSTATRKNLYQIEVLFFAHATTDKILTEQFPENPGLPSTRSAQEINIADIGAKLQLLAVRRKLDLSKQYTVLLHTAWQQLLHANMASKMRHISDTDLEGTIRVRMVGDMQVIADILFAASSSQNYRLQQKWHVKKNKIYYFDHPKFGFLVIVYPI